MRHYLLVVLLVLMSQFSVGQSISVASFEKRSNDMDARIHSPVKDQNGDLCALLKIETTETGFVFEGGSLGIMKTEKKTGEYWVYVPYGSKRISIKHDQLGILRDYMFPEPIEKATVYLMKLTTATLRTIVEDVVIESQWLVINSEPTGANVFIDDQLAGSTPFQRKYKASEYTYRLEKNRYHPQAGKIDLSVEKEKLDLILKPKFGDIYISSVPESDMQIYLDDENTGKTTPATLKAVASGAHNVKLQSQWFQPQTKVLTVNDEQSTNVDFVMQPAYAELSITAKPNADILIDGERKASGSWNGRLLSGIYSIKAEKSKYYSEEKQIEIIAEKDETLSFNLKGKTGSVDVITTPMEAKVYLNGELQGTSPMTLKDLLIGEYEIGLEKSGYGIITKTVDIKENESIRVEEKLPQGKEITIISTPSGANLSIDGENRGSTPYTGTLSFGSHSIKLVNGKKVVEESISVNQAGKNRWEFDVRKIPYGLMTDTRDGKTYKTVKIGKEIWMADNLNYRTTDSWCYDNESHNCDKYGRLYKWESAKNTCPDGWHLPSKRDFKILLKSVDKSNVYNALTEGGESGFSIPLGGWGNSKTNFSGCGYIAYYWTSTYYVSSGVWYFDIYKHTESVDLHLVNKNVGLSVRCIKD
ncbi:MAG: PEGA domain-containing protein [Bacteroidales bacterium]|jgi:uncharacterized protein (TIGR02145 family)|nr:PEGA domain-containing protein [Bacteroidales bacterium]